MSAEEAKERRNFLAAYHLLKFSKADKDNTEAADIERRCLAAKYLSAREFDSVETASGLLRRSLEDYQTLMENKNGVNNYWKQFKAQTQNIENDPRKWKSGLEDVETVLGFAKPLPCQQKNTLPCKEINLTDRDVENIVNIWKNKQASGRQRKISCQEKSKLKEETESDRSRYNAGSGSQPNPFIPDVSMEDSSGEVSNTSRQLSRFHSVPNESQNLAGQRSVNRPQFRPAKEQYTVTFNKNEKPNIYRSNAKLKPQMCAQQNEEDTEPRNKFSAFRSARDELSIQQMKSNRPGQKKTLGGKGSLSAQFVCPLKKEKEKAMQARENSCEGESGSGEMEDERLKNIEPKMVELIKNEIMDSKTATTWNDIAGLEYAKKIIMEVVVYPMLRPDIFTGLRRPPKGILLFGPPGTGKTLIGKCIASQSKSTFFSISASSLTSKWIGEGEKMVRALFAVARVYQPAVVFVDEIDSLLTQRSETEHESSRRLKTEFLVQLDGAATAEDDRILIVGATNRPQELDEAARRRLVKRLYVPLPEFGARKQIISKLLLSVPHNLTEEDVTEIAERSRGYSGADMTNLCKEASMGPIRSIPFSQLENIRKEDVRQVTIDDFKEALIHVRPSVSESSISAYVEWDSIYGTGTAQNYTA